MSTPSPRLQAAQTYLSSFATLSIPAFSSVLSENYTHVYAPSSLAKAINREGYASKDAFLEHIRGMTRLMTGFPVTPLRMIEDSTENAVWAWAKGEVHWREDVVDDAMQWDYQGEYVFMFWMDGEGKIERCVEMLDSWETREKLMGLSGRAKENVKRRTGEKSRWLENE